MPALVCVCDGGRKSVQTQNKTFLTLEVGFRHVLYVSFVSICVLFI